jgi:hypothetical protein
MSDIGRGHGVCEPPVFKSAGTTDRAQVLFCGLSDVVLHLPE